MDFNKVISFVKESGKNAVALYAFDVVGLTKFYEGEKNAVIKYIKIGGIFYVVKWTIEAVENQGMPKVDIIRIVDDSLFYAVAGYISDMAGLTTFIDRSVPNVLPTNALEAALKSGVLWEVIEEGGKLTENTSLDFVRHLSKSLGIH